MSDLWRNTKDLTDKETIAKLQGQVAELIKAVEVLTKENLDLRARLAKYENPKNSGNSSIAPSQDPFRKTRSLREKSNRPQGGQKGHKGSRLRMTTCPDVIVGHSIGYCSCCGKGLGQAAEGYDARQVLDIPPISIQVTEHRILHKTCGSCGTLNKGEFPKDLKQEAQYGNGLRSLCVYLQNYQMLPFSRCKEFIADLTGHHISTGSLTNFQKQCFNNLQDYEQTVKQQLLQSLILHADETGLRLSGKNSWIHVLSNC